MNKLMIFALAFALFCCACKNDGVYIIADNEMVDMVEADMVSLEDAMADAAAIASNVSTICAATNDSSVSKSDGNFQVSAMWEWKVNCTNNIPSDLDMKMGGSVSYSDTGISTQGDMTGEWNLGNLISTDNYLFDGFVDLDLDIEIIARRSVNQYIGEAIYDFDAIEVDRTSYEIQAGSCTLSMSGTFTNGSTYMRTATLTFSGNGSASLVLDNGRSFTINL